MILGIIASAIRAANAALSYDPYFDKVTALLHLDGADGSTTITDVTGRVWSTYSGAKLGTANPKFGTSALDLVGQVAGEANTTRIFSEAKNHTFGSRDFTVELFARQNRVDARSGVLAAVDYEDSGSSSAWRAWSIAIDGNGRPYARISSDGTSYTKLLANTVVPVEGYYHYALVRKGNLVRLFLDGVQQAEATFTAAMFESPIGMTIGSWATAKDEAFKGQIDEFRITDGVARYWDNFTPPTRAFYDTGAPKPTDPYFDKVSLLLHAESPDGSGTIVDSSSNARTPSSKQDVQIQAATHKVGEGALRGIGTPPVLTYGPSTDFDLAGVYTFEFWIYVDQYPEGTCYWLANSGVAYFTMDAGGNLGGNGSGIFFGKPIPLNTWVHLAGTRDSNNVARSFMDGKLVNTDNGNYTKQGSSSLGIFSIPGRTDLRGLKAYIDEFRWTAGVARYTSDFTPSTTPFPDSGPPVAPPATDPLWDNVALLMHFDAADGSNTFTYFSKGAEINSSDGFNAVYQRSAQKKFGPTSLKADSNAAKLNFTAHASLALPLQFTIEFWMYPTAVDVTGYLLGANGARYFTIDGEGTLIFYGLGGALVLGKPAKDTWTHVAVSRDAGGNLRAFLNGKLMAATTSSSIEANPQPLGIVNIPGNANAAAFSYGYIDEVRITTGATRYTTEFTPPTEAFPSRGEGNRKVGDGRVFNRDSFLKLATDDMHVYLPGPLTFLVDVTPAALPFDPETMPLTGVSYDNYSGPYICWSANDAYRRVGMFLRDATASGRQISLDGGQTPVGRIRVLVTYDAGATKQPSAGNVQVWLNGNNVVNSTSLPPSMPDLIGARSNPPAKSGTNNTAFDGIIRAVAFWNRVLTAEEISAISAAADYAPADYSGLIHAWLPGYIANGQLANEVKGAPGATLVML